MKKLWGLIPLTIFLIFSVFFWRGLSLDPRQLPSVQIGKKLPNFQLQSLEGTAEKFSAAQFKGKVTLLNVWASWCGACTDEQVFLLALAREGFPIYGLNYKDNPQEALHWLTEWGNPYQNVGKDLDGRVAIDLGVYGAPETFLIDSSGTIQYRYAGPLNKTVWEHEFLPRINQLQGKG
jgi:cytochrome c biogenesis protein CcmG/thiol:disulfide interchange protein DsbE